MAVVTGQWFGSDGVLSCLTGSCLFSLDLLAVFSSLVTERFTGVVILVATRLDCSELAKTNFPCRGEDVAMMTWPWDGKTRVEATGWDMWDRTGDNEWGVGDI